MCSGYPGIKLEPALGTQEDKIEHLSSYAHVVHSTAKQAILGRRKNDNVLKNVKRLEMHVQRAQKYCFSFVKYPNLSGFCCRRRRGCLSSLMSIIERRLHDRKYLY